MNEIIISDDNILFVDMLCISCWTSETWSNKEFEYMKYEDIICLGCGNDEFNITLNNKWGIKWLEKIT